VCPLSSTQLREGIVLHSSSLCTLRTSKRQYIIHAFSSLIYNFCMMPVMVKEADLDCIEVPDGYEVPDATEDHDVVRSTLL
jgi:hypothetical protein